MKIFIDQISDIVKDVFEELGYDRESGKVTVSNRPDLCQYQCNGALMAAKEYKKAPIMIANDVIEKLKNNDILDIIMIIIHITHKVFNFSVNFVN